MPGDSHFIDWGVPGRQVLAERRRWLVAMGSVAPLHPPGPRMGSEVSCHGVDRGPVEWNGTGVTHRSITMVICMSVHRAFETNSPGADLGTRRGPTETWNRPWVGARVGSGR